MSTLKAFLIALLTTFIIGGCGSTGDDGTFNYPFQEQTWSVESGDSARWTGSSSFNPKATVYATLADSSDSTGTDSTKTDTTFINQPNKYGLEIAQSFEDSLYEIRFIDSTYWIGKETEYPYIDTLFNKAPRTVGRSYFDKYVEVKAVYPFDCEANPQPADTLNLVYAPYESPADTVDYYKVVISGALETVDHIICD